MNYYVFTTITSLYSSEYKKAILLSITKTVRTYKIFIIKKRDNLFRLSLIYVQK